MTAAELRAREAVMELHPHYGAHEPEHAVALASTNARMVEIIQDAIEAAINDDRSDRAVAIWDAAVADPLSIEAMLLAWAEKEAGRFIPYDSEP